MKATLCASKEKVWLQTTNVAELNKLSKFPGLCKEDGEYWIPAKVNVLHNLFSRLRYYLPGSTVSEEVRHLRSQKEDLTPLPASFYYHTTPLPHQDLGVRVLWTRRNLGLLADPGLGKTKMVLDYIFLLKQAHAKNRPFKGLVVCPKPLLFVWLMEAAKHRPELKVHVVEGINYAQKIREREALPSTKEIEAEIRSLKKLQKAENEGIASCDVVVVNYTKVVLGEVFFVKNQWDVLAIDEGLVKNPYSQQTDVLTKISKKTSNRVIMSGTLINNGPEDVFSPVRIIEPALLGTSFSKFNKYYGIEVKSGERRFVVGYRDRDEIKGCLHACSLVLRKEEWLKDLPEKTFKVIKVPLSEQARILMDDLQANMTVQVGDDWIEVDNHLSLYCKMSQISNGFIYTKNTEEEQIDIGLHTGIYSKKQKQKRSKGKTAKSTPTAKREVVFLEDQPKVQALKELLQPGGEVSKLRLVLWYNMAGELDLISKLLKDLDIKYLVVKGGTKNTGQVIEDFNNDSSIQVLVCQAKAVNYGVTILGHSIEDCDYEPELSSEVFTHVFYSLNNSLEVFIQQQDRSHRIGLRKPPCYYILQTDCFIENSTYDRLLSRQEIREDFLVDITKTSNRRFVQ